MDIKIYEKGQEVHISSDQMERIERLIRDTKTAQLSTKGLREIERKSFIVEDYQRGYRWTETEIEELLGDINGISETEKGYCMQPLVVKRIESFQAVRKLTADGVQDSNGDRPSGVRVKVPNCFQALVAIVQIPVIGKYKRRLTVEEVARLQSFPVDAKQNRFIPDENKAQAYKQFGNSVNVEVIRRAAEQLFLSK